MQVPLNAVRLALTVTALVGGGGALLAATVGSDEPARTSTEALQASLKKQAEVLQRLERQLARQVELQGRDRLISDLAQRAQLGVASPPPDPDANEHADKATPAIATRTAPTDATSRPPPTPKQLELAEAAGTLLATAVRRGRWDPAERSQIREKFGDLTGAQQADLLAGISQALNEGTLRGEPSELPF